MVFAACKLSGRPFRHPDCAQDADPAGLMKAPASSLCAACAKGLSDAGPLAHRFLTHQRLSLSAATGAPADSHAGPRLIADGVMLHRRQATRHSSSSVTSRPWTSTAPPWPPAPTTLASTQYCTAIARQRCMRWASMWRPWQTALWRLSWTLATCVCISGGLTHTQQWGTMPAQHR